MKKTIEKVQLEIDKTDKQIDNLKLSNKFEWRVCYES